MLSDTTLLGVILQCVIRLSVILPIAIVLIVVAPFKTKSINSFFFQMIGCETKFLEAAEILFLINLSYIPLNFRANIHKTFYDHLKINVSMGYLTK
jgi:hypothetical protein